MKGDHLHLQVSSGLQFIVPWGIKCPLEYLQVLATTLKIKIFLLYLFAAFYICK